MGIVNLTDNSFLSSSRLGIADIDAVLERVSAMLENGADIIDVGACSTAPGNEPVSPETEWMRLSKVLPVLFEAFPSAEFSLDTFRAEIVSRSLEFGRKFIVNDVAAGSFNDDMLSIVRANSLRYVAVDSSSSPYDFFGRFSCIADSLGIPDWILDPGFGFGKTIEQNWAILNDLERFKCFGREILVALSRKRMIYVPLGLTPETCSERSIQAECLAVSKGATIIRTHDVVR